MRAQDVPGPASRGPAANSPYDVAAVMHVHSSYSDGVASVEEILDAAADAEADVVLLTDYDTLQARRDGHEGWHQGVLLLVGLEISPEEAHFLAFGVDEEIEHRGRSAGEICAELEHSGALGFPTLSSCDDVGDLPITGLELWSLVSDAAETSSSHRELASFISRPEQAIDHPPARNLEEWDRLCRERRVVAIAGVDAHRAGSRFPGGPVLSPRRNARFFRMLRTHLLCDAAPCGDLERDRALILRTLREGRCYLARDSLAGSRGFRFYAAGPGRSFVPMGGEAPAGNWTLHARLPRDAHLRVMRDGEEIWSGWIGSLELRAPDPGVYRVEARLNARGRPRTWILSNPIYLR